MHYFTVILKHSLLPYSNAHWTWIQTQTLVDTVAIMGLHNAALTAFDDKRLMKGDSGARFCRRQLYSLFFTIHHFLAIRFSAKICHIELRPSPGKNEWRWQARGQG